MMSGQYGPQRTPIYRSRDESVFFGVCGGIGEHFEMPPWGVRAVFILLTFVGFPFTIIFYFVLAMIMKLEPARHYENYEEEDFWNTYRHSRVEALRKIDRTFEKLDKRLQRMETIVTSPSFELKDEYEKL